MNLNPKAAEFKYSPSQQQFPNIAAQGPWTTAEVPNDQGTFIGWHEDYVSSLPPLQICCIGDRYADD